MSYFAFPWEQLGNLLRTLSLSGAAGNVLAWILFAAAGTGPAAVWIWLSVKKKSVRADMLLLLLSPILAVGLWFLANPSYMGSCLIPAPLAGMGKYAVGLTIDSVLLAWLVLRFLSGCEKPDRGRVLRSLQIFLGIYVALAAAAVLWQGFRETAAGFKGLAESNTVTGGGWMTGELLAGSGVGQVSGAGDLRVSSWFLVLQTLCSCLPEFLELTLLGMVIALLHSCEKGGFTEESLRWVERLKNCSCRFLAVMVCVNMGINLLQLFFGRLIHNSYFSLVFPLREIIVVLGILMLSRFYLESRRLKEDNELFI